MSLLTRYIIRQSSLSIALVIGAISGLLLVMGIADEAARRVNDSYQLADAVRYELLTLPADLKEYAVVMIALGTLISVASMNKHQELVSIQLQANSSTGLIVRLLAPALLLLPLIMLFNGWLVPNLSESAEIKRAELLGQNRSRLAGQWYRSNNEFINIEFITTDGKLLNITHLSYDANNQLQRTVQAKSGEFSNNQWQLNEAVVLDFKNDRSELQEKETIQLNASAFTPQRLLNMNQNPKFLTLQQLAEQVLFRSKAGTLTPAFELNFWRNLYFPLYYIALLLIALSFAFGSFRQKSVGDAAFKVVAIGVLVGVMLDTAVTALMLTNLPAWLAALIVHITLLAAGVSLVRKAY